MRIHELEYENKLLKEDIKRKDKAIDELSIKLFEALLELHNYRRMGLDVPMINLREGGTNVN